MKFAFAKLFFVIVVYLDLEQTETSYHIIQFS